MQPLPLPADELDICLAPLRGVTGCAFREQFSRHFSGISRAVSPFISTVKGTRIKAALLDDIRPEKNARIPLIPQVIGKDPDELAVMLATFREMGFHHADLNVGCPWPMVVRRGRGAGLLPDSDRLRRMLDVGCAVMPGGFSIKTRLGLTTPDLLAQRMTLFNEYPLREMTIHPRTARQMYEGYVHLAEFAACLRLSRHRVVYNGDLRTVQDIQRLRVAFPQIKHWMIGRGIIADPFLPERLRGDQRPRDLARLRALMDDLLSVACEELHGEKPVLGRFKEYWSYLAPRLSRDGMLLRRIHLCHRIDEYRRVVNACFDASPEWIEAPHGIPEKDGCF